jgi:hypothetical protein
VLLVVGDNEQLGVSNVERFPFMSVHVWSSQSFCSDSLPGEYSERLSPYSNALW